MVAIWIVSLGSAVQAEQRIYIPDEADLLVITQELSSQMLDPASTRVSNVLAADNVVDGQAMTWICGNVQGRNSFGGYAQPVPFMGTFLNSPTKGRVYITMSIADNNPAAIYSVTSTCLERLRAEPNGGSAEDRASPSAKPDGLDPIVTAPSARPKTRPAAPQGRMTREVARLLGEAIEMQERCAGPEGENPDSDVCHYRDSLVVGLNEMGWCWGIEGQTADQADWHPCRPDSIRQPW